MAANDETWKEQEEEWEEVGGGGAWGRWVGRWVWAARAQLPFCLREQEKVGAGEMEMGIRLSFVTFWCEAAPNTRRLAQSFFFKDIYLYFPWLLSEVMWFVRGQRNKAK